MPGIERDGEELPWLSPGVGRDSTAQGDKASSTNAGDTSGPTDALSSTETTGTEIPTTSGDVTSTFVSTSGAPSITTGDTSGPTDALSSTETTGTEIPTTSGDVTATFESTSGGPKCKPTKSWYAQPGASFDLPGFCPSTATVLGGDFNGDGRMDLMCHDKRNLILYYGSDTGYSDIGWIYNGWCSHPGASIYVGDFDGDSHSDVLCHDTNGHVFIAFANSVGELGGVHDWNKDMGFCTGGAPRKLFIGDFDGDGRSDMLCHNSHTGYKKIAYANVGGDFENPRMWNKNMFWCYTGHPKLYVGDFNGDGRDDMLCHDDNRNMFVAIARSGGKFVASDYADNMGICRAEGCTLSIATASRDTKADIVCHCKDPNPEPIIIRFPYGRYSFEIFRQWRRNRMWCTGASDELVVGPLKPGRCGVLVCIDRVAKTASIANAG